MKKTDSDKRSIVFNYLRKNPEATYNEIRKGTKLHPERIFKKGLKEAFEEAGIKSPRNFERKTKDERRKIVIDYIKKNPKAGGHTIAKKTKINPSNVFKSIKEAYEKAGIKYPRRIDKRTKKEKINLIIKLVRENPIITIPEIMEKLHVNPYKFFKNVDEIYRRAGIEKINGSKKWRIKKQRDVLNFIKQNPLATQREINLSCKTHVQDLFKKGIFEAYKKAGINFPFERLKLYGVGLKEIRKRAKDFESEIAIKLTSYGKVNRLVKTRRGIADIILERKGKKAVIEIKDYQSKDISNSQIKQLNKYLEDSGCCLGVLICRNKPRKDKFLINKNRIIILDETELGKICEFIDGCVVHWQ
ncbi:MAG TPA: hypothetical protein VJ438_06100 [Candidatus Nanoarchaeia archaeon]|nr:hypothetical protein [Candidatus Nanoarchaeia archaeon]